MCLPRLHSCHHRWFRDPSLPILRTEVTRFPHAVGPCFPSRNRVAMCALHKHVATHAAVLTAVRLPSRRPNPRPGRALPFFLSEFLCASRAQVLEIALALPEGEGPPEWVAELVDSGASSWWLLYRTWCLGTACLSRMTGSLP